MNAEQTKAIATVYVVEQQPFDYSPATVYGQLSFMESKKLAPMSPNAPDRWNANILAQIRKDLMDYVPGVDLILPTGAPTRMVLVGMVLAEKGSKHRLLGWDGHSQRYLEYVISL